MARQHFDALDFKILKMLSSNARKPFLEIARETNVSGAAIHQRIQKLTSSGIIKGFETIIDPASVGYDTCAYIGFILNDSSKFNEVVQVLKEIPEVVDCHFTTGSYDIFAKIFARTNEHLLDVIHKISLGAAGRTETLISFKEVFKRPIPIQAENFD
ncbi:MAG: Lrp/AsnC ligand binding domain-containing protein [Duncaniella sp.]|uniref:Lrp/AsnC family transcriptional regulator n=1 Tax=Duncaniella sp. TaxID=2518496 RepID=UPI0023C74A1D|nr:winged helix-turn-helix transcriptional regulator [Duncaniella sp.]MDE5989422.1 Lrp/AsnC ligand binding domain-containing protein [Duncaniella sp.]